MEFIITACVKTSFIKDYLKDYLFQRLIRYYTYRLVQRHPNIFKSIGPLIKANVPHQFQDAMDQKSEEYTGDLFTKSETRTEDLIDMMTIIQQKYVHKKPDRDACYERRILSGDQKTEKNCHFGILSKMDESTEKDKLNFLQIAHEYFHQGMVLADIENELFRDGSRGLEGGAYFAATLLNRKEARTKKGKEAIDAFEEFFLLKSDVRFCQYTIKKYGLQLNKDNTPSHLKTAQKEEKLSYIYGLVANSLKDLMPCFSNAKDVDPELTDHPVRCQSSEAQVLKIYLLIQEYNFC